MIPEIRLKRYLDLFLGWDDSAYLFCIGPLQLILWR